MKKAPQVNQLTDQCGDERQQGYNSKKSDNEKILHLIGHILPHKRHRCQSTNFTNFTNVSQQCLPITAETDETNSMDVHGQILDI